MSHRKVFSFATVSNVRGLRREKVSQTQISEAQISEGRLVMMFAHLLSPADELFIY